MRNYKKRKSTAIVNAMEKSSQMHRAFHTSITFEDWLRNNMYNRIAFEFEVRNDVMIVKFSAYPKGPGSDESSGVIDTYEGYSMRFNIEPKLAIDNLMKYLREKPLREKIIQSPEVIEH